LQQTLLGVNRPVDAVLLNRRRGTSSKTVDCDIRGSVQPFVWPSQWLDTQRANDEERKNWRSCISVFMYRCVIVIVYHLLSYC